MKIFTDWQNSKSKKGFEGFIFSEKCNAVKKAVKRIKKRGLLILLMLAQISLFNEYVFAQRMFPETNDMIFLENENIKVSLSKDRPIIYDYLYKPNNGSISGDISRATPRIVFYKGVENVMRNFTNISYKATHTDSKVIYHVRATYENKPAVEFDLIYSLVDEDLVVDGEADSSHHPVSAIFPAVGSGCVNRAAGRRQISRACRIRWPSMPDSARRQRRGQARLTAFQDPRSRLL